MLEPSQIQAILDAPAMTQDQRRLALLDVAATARDVDDFETYDRARELAAPADGKPITIGGSFREMYRAAEPGLRRVLVLKGKHGQDLVDISTPDDFARAFLATVRSRLAEGLYRDHEARSEAERPATAAYLDEVLRVHAGKAIDLTGTIWIRELKRSPVTQEIAQEVPAAQLLRRLETLAASSPDVRDNAGIALIAVQLIFQEAYTATVQRLLSGLVDLPAGLAVLSELAESSHQTKAEGILAMAPERLRKAGRLAYLLMKDRREWEYEGFSFAEVRTVPAAEALGDLRS